MSVIHLDDSVCTLRGVGASKTKQLERVGIYTVRDLLYYFPRAYEQRGNVCKLSQAEENTPTALASFKSFSACWR